MSDIEPAWLSAVEVARLVRGGMLDRQAVVQAHLRVLIRCVNGSSVVRHRLARIFRLSAILELDSHADPESP